MGSVNTEETLAEVSVESQRSIDQPVRWRYRLLYSKLGPLKYISHLDLARLWERIFRRATLPLVYSQGFNPRPKIQLATGLPLGYLSVFEVVDFWVEKPVESFVGLSEKIDRAAPDGLKVLTACGVDLNDPALQSVTDTATYRVSFQNVVPDDLDSRISDFLSLGTLIRSRRDRQYDLRPLVDVLSANSGEPPTIEMTLALSQTRGTARPDEVMDALHLSDYTYEVLRTKIALVSPYQLGI